MIGWDKQDLVGKGFGGRAVVSHISQKTSEMWGTRGLVVTEKEKRQGFDGASPRLSYPTYAGANVGHPDRVGVRGRVDDHAAYRQGQGTMTEEPRSVSSFTASRALFASSSEKVTTWG